MNRDQRLERFQRLDRALEADRSWLDIVFGRRLSNDLSNEVVGRNVRPDLFSHQFGRPAPQDVHLHRLLERPQIERTFAWLMRYRRHSRDYEKTTASSEAMTYLAMISLMSKRLAEAET